MTEQQTIDLPALAEELRAAGWPTNNYGVPVGEGVRVVRTKLRSLVVWARGNVDVPEALDDEDWPILDIVRAALVRAGLAPAPRAAEGAGDE